MQQIPLSDLAVAPGRVFEWEVRSPAIEQGTSRYASFNQEKHFSAAMAARAEHASDRNWVAMTFEMPGRVDLGALERALRLFVRRHEVLRCTFGDLGGDLGCQVIPAADIELERVEVGSFDTAEDTRAHLGRRFDETINALSWPTFVLGAVVAPMTTTVYLAFDHIVCDGMSIVVAVEDLWSAYNSMAHGTSLDLPAVGSYVDFGMTQRQRFADLTADSAELAYWRRFIAGAGEFFPRMPLDFGVRAGELHPAANQTTMLLDDAGATAFEAACRERGGTLCTGLLAAAGMALREVTGIDTYRALLPIGERREPRWRQAFGWFVNTMPIEFPVSSRSGFDTVIRDARAAFGEMLTHADTPFIKAWELLAPQHYQLRMWPYAVNFFSYLDFRKLPGARHHAITRPCTIPQASHANTGNTWFFRNHTGIHLNTIFPDTSAGHRAMNGYRGALAHLLGELSRASTCDVAVRQLVESA